MTNSKFLRMNPLPPKNQTHSRAQTIPNLLWTNPQKKHHHSTHRDGRHFLSTSGGDNDQHTSETNQLEIQPPACYFIRPGV